MYSDNKHIFVLGKSLTGNSDRLVHLWKEDRAEVNYNNKDALIGSHKTGNEYEIRFFYGDRDYLYSAGNKGKSLFIWKYALAYLNRQPEEIILNSLDFSDVSGVVCYKEQYLVSIGRHVYAISQNDEVIMSLLVDRPLRGLALNSLGLTAIEGSYFVVLSLPTFDKTAGILTYEIFSDTEVCNNIDVFVKGADTQERVALYNQAGETIQPTAYITHKGNTIIKLINSHATRITLQLQVTPNSVVDGIVVKKNRIFLR
jgi:hypothetical protein